VVVTWTTSEPASSQVEYGTSTSYGSVVPATPMFDPTTGQSAGVVTHSVELTGLQNSTTYHFRVKSKDKAKNEGISADNTFTVQAPPEE
jgi:phosphodiesterase/alkaline phosphatase D-like protein